jgi:hypothetical protein
MMTTLIAEINATVENHIVGDMQYLIGEAILVDACQYFYECENCETYLKPLKGDCCVFCSYGTIKCPPLQAAIHIGANT